MSSQKFRKEILILLCLGAPNLALTAQNDIQLGSIETDPPTLCCLGFSVPITSGDDNHNAEARVEYREQGSATWQTGLPLMRVRPEFAEVRRQRSFAGSIFGLREGTAYEVRITVTDPDGGAGVLNVTATTRAAPRANPVTPRTVNVSTSAQLTAALLNAAPGDVITLAPGTYVGNFQVSADTNGTANNPIFIRGVDRDTVILKGTGSSGFQIYGDYVTLEDVTIDTAISGVFLRDNEWAVIRRTTIKNVDRGIEATYGTHRNYTIYDNILEGNNVWPAIDSSTWDDEGIAVTGEGHAVFHNTLSGFGDALSLSRFTDIPNRAIDFYRNEVLWTGDDGLELDDGERNIRAFENRVTNSGTLISIQPNFDTGGPIYGFRNVGINQARRPFKLNDSPSGFYLFHNTAVKTMGTDDWIWTQFNNGPIENFQLKNNVLVRFSPNTTRAVAFEAPTTEADYDYNGYFPDGSFWLGPEGSYNSFQESQDNGSPFDNKGRILTQPIFETPISLGVDYTTFANPQDVTLHPSSDALQAGVVIPHINDGYQGTAPDLGAYERGGPLPSYGARLDDEK